MMYHILEKDSEEDLAHNSQHPRQCFHKKKKKIIQFLRKERGRDIHQSKRITLWLCTVLMDHY